MVALFICIFVIVYSSSKEALHNKERAIYRKVGVFPNKSLVEPFPKCMRRSYPFHMCRQETKSNFHCCFRESWAGQGMCFALCSESAFLVPAEVSQTDSDALLVDSFHFCCKPNKSSNLSLHQFYATIFHPLAFLPL